MRVHTEINGLGADRVVVVRLAGDLTVQSAPAVRTGLLKALTEQPALVVADVAALTTSEDVTLSLFPAVARHAAAWPGIPLVLAQPGRALSRALERTAACRHIPVFDTVDEACRAADRTPPRRLAERFAAAPGSIAAARALVRDACHRWNVSALADVGELIVTELTSNAVRHVGADMDVSVALRSRYLHLSVRDRSTEPPRLGRGDGRGLILVEALTVSWGSTLISDGKVVWATLRLP